MVDAVGVPIGAEVIKHRSYGQKVQEIVGGRATHPVFGLPGGVSKQISEEERVQMEEMAKSCVEFGKFTIKLFHDVVLGNKDYLGLILNPDVVLPRDLLHGHGRQEQQEQLLRRATSAWSTRRGRSS